MRNQILAVVISATIFSIKSSIAMEFTLEEQPQFQLPRQRQDHFQYLKGIDFKQRPIKILSLDGGGIRGLLELIWLQEIERETGRLCTDLFDAFVGTSTGGIIAAGLAAGSPLEELMSYYNGPHKDTMFSKELSEVHEKNNVTKTLNSTVNSSASFLKNTTYTITQTVIDEGFGMPSQSDFWSAPLWSTGQAITSFIWKPILQTGADVAGKALSPLVDKGSNSLKSLYSGIFSSRYSAEGAESVYKIAFQSSTLSDLHKPAFITATKLCKNGTYKLHMFDSIKAQQDFSHNQKLWEVLRATSAAPTYFPPLTLEINNEEEIFVDGGIMCNNPSLEGYFLVKNYFPNAQYKVFSLSTGQFYNINEHNHGDGVLGWVEGIINATMQTQSDNADKVLREILGDNYHRLHTVELERETSQMDNVSPENLDKLIETAKKEIKGDQFTKIIDSLLSDVSF